MKALVIIFGVLAVLYIALVIIKRARAPRTGERRVKAQIESIFKLRVPVQAIGDRGRMTIGNTVIPSTVYQMVFREDNSNETHTFSVKDEVAQQWKEKDQGVLTYNGDQFIDFEEK